MRLQSAPPIVTAMMTLPHCRCEKFAIFVIDSGGNAICPDLFKEKCWEDSAYPCTPMASHPTLPWLSWTLVAPLTSSNKQSGALLVSIRSLMTAKDASLE